MSVTLSTQYEKKNPPNAIGIDTGSKGWKNSAVKNKFPRFANLFAISSLGPSNNLLKN